VGIVLKCKMIGISVTSYCAIDRFYCDCYRWKCYTVRDILLFSDLVVFILKVAFRIRCCGLVTVVFLILTACFSTSWYVYDFAELVRCPAMNYEVICACM